MPFLLRRRHRTLSHSNEIHFPLADWTILSWHVSQGGLKAVVWTDVVQTISMLGALLLVAVKGTMEVDGVGQIFDDAYKTERIEPPK